MNELYERINELCKRKGISGYRLCKDTGLQPSFLTDLKMGRQNGISPRKAATVAAYLGVSEEFLLYGRENDAPPVVSDYELKAAFFGGENDLSPEEIEALWQETKDYIEFRKKQMKRR